MSLYNMLFGVEPTADIALKMLGVGPHDVPRFRDAYFKWADNTQTDPVIVIHTRTGGGNREAYRSENDRLTALVGYRYDRDDNFDSTYADFFFSVPEAEREGVITFLKTHGEPLTAQEKFKIAIEAMKAPKTR